MSSVLEKIGLGILVIPIAVFVVAIFFLIFGFVIQWAWNTVMPAVFDLPTITYWQAVALEVLVSPLRQAVTTATSQTLKKD